MAQISDNSIDYKSWKTNVKNCFVLNNNRMSLKRLPNRTAFLFNSYQRLVPVVFNLGIQRWISISF